MSFDGYILTVNHQDGDSKALMEFLTNEGYKYRRTDKIANAINSIVRETPILILFDLDTPGPDIVEFSEKLKNVNQTKHIPIVITCSSMEPELLKRCIEAGCVDFIIKPFRKQEVLARVGAHSQSINVRGKVERNFQSDNETDQNNIKAVVKKIEEQFYYCFKMSDFAIWEYCFSTNKLYYSNNLNNIFGNDLGMISNFSPETILNQLHPGYRERITKSLKDHLDKKTSNFCLSFPILIKPKTYRWFKACCNTKWNENGNPLNFSGSLLDINEKVILREKLALTDERFKNLINYFPLAIARFSIDGIIRQVNKAWQILWDVNDYETSCLIGKYNFLGDNQVQQLGHMNFIEQAFKGKNVVLPPIDYFPERLMDDLDLSDEVAARPRTIQVHLFPFYNNKGELISVFSVNFDLTEQKQLELQNVEQKEKLTRLNRSSSLGHLTGSIAHELNQPLTGILSNAQAAEIILLSGEALKSSLELKEMIKDIITDTKRADNIVQSLRKLFSKRKIDFTEVDINSVVRESIGLLNSEAIINKVSLELDLDIYIQKAKANKIQIQQVLINLLMNAIEAFEKNQTDRKIVIITKNIGPNIELTVEDNGPGIENEKMGLVLNPLATWKSGGIGMGLAISNSIIEVHNGHMILENKTSGGARVGFSIPIDH